ncbi:hypothetical protein RhiirC2_798922 [Rhizophagus irregularis]|uniref:Uncharacterized protein n=1 Tax=Rhizophagus irregularis TaxID=588596 RepID=A0A2N1M5Q4_9GLOM|nr:hypothetical protein RhiirC2_798922 [Rhizophagus irregularis]
MKIDNDNFMGPKSFDSRRRSRSIKAKGEDCIAAVDASGDAARSGSGGKISTDFPLSAELEGKCWESSRKEPEAGAEGDALVSTGMEDEVEALS